MIENPIKLDSGYLIVPEEPGLGISLNEKTLKLGENPKILETPIGFDGSVIYQVALDKVSFMPLSSVDSASGIIITDWYNIADNNLRLKINIRILDESLSDESLSVSIFKQSFDSQKWVDEGSDPDQASKIKRSILEEARVLQATIDLS